MGCSDCKTSGGCDTRKGTQREVLDEVISRIYPERVWGRPDDEARFGAGISRGAARRLGRALSAVAKAPAYFRAGAEEDLCDFVWILCVGREPAVVEVRDGMAALDESPVPGVAIEEKYLRVALSSVARLAAMQEVTLSLTAEEDGSLVVRETARPGVFDPILLKRVRKIVALLEASDVAHIDFGLLDRPLDNAQPGDYEERYGAQPMLVNFLFQASPSTAASVTLAGSPPVAVETDLLEAAQP